MHAWGACDLGSIPGTPTLLLFQEISATLRLKQPMIHWERMKSLEMEVRYFLEERGWDTHCPSNVAKSISIEAAELLELFQWSNNTLKDVRSDEHLMNELKKELADVFIYALEMAVLLDIDTSEIVLDKLDQIKQKYPADLMKTDIQSGFQFGSTSQYMRIKNDHRD